MLPSVVAKCLYRKLNRCSSDYKLFHSVCIGSSRVIRPEIFIGETSPLRYLSGSAYLFDKSETKDATSPKSNQSHQKVISQSATGDIVVKTETDANKVVTKVTIERNPTQNQEHLSKQVMAAPPGNTTFIISCLLPNRHAYLFYFNYSHNILDTCFSVYS